MLHLTRTIPQELPSVAASGDALSSAHLIDFMSAKHSTCQA